MLERDRMIITVALNSEAASKAATTGQTANLRNLVAGDEIRVVKVFGRGRFANIEASQEAYLRLKERLGHLCVFTPELSAKPF